MIIMEPNLYMDFLKSMDKVKEKILLMHHLPSEIYIVSKHFSGYLTDEELQERQYKGRFWDIRYGEHYYLLQILVDNETVAIVDSRGKIKILERDEYNLPDSLRGRYYYDEY